VLAHEYEGRRILGVIAANPDKNTMRIATHGGVPQKAMRGILHPPLCLPSSRSARALPK
jgi:hypothetical protein